MDEVFGRSNSARVGGCCVPARRLHASLQVRAQQARHAGRAGEAEEWSARAQRVWDAVMAGNQAMLEYLQREAGYSRAGYHVKGSGRFADAHEWVIASFAQHTSRDNDPQLHVHNAILNRVLREDPLASCPGDRQRLAHPGRGRAVRGETRRRGHRRADSRRIPFRSARCTDGRACRREWMRDSRLLRGSAGSSLLPAPRHPAAGPPAGRRIRTQIPNGSERASDLVHGAIRHARFAPGEGAFGAVAGGAAGAMGRAIAARRNRGAQRHPGGRARPQISGNR